MKCNNQGQFRNPQEKLILKLSLVVRFNKEMTEILTVKEKAPIYKLTTFLFILLGVEISSINQYRN